MHEVVAGLDAWTLLLVLATAGLYASALTAAGGSLFRLIFVGHPPLERGAGCRPTIVVAAWLAIAMALLQGPLQAGFLAGGTLAGAFDPTLLVAVFEANQGSRIVLLICGLLLLHGVLLDAPRAANWGKALSVLGVALIMLSFTQVGHTTGGEPRWLLASLLVLHLAAVAFWIGALIPLFRMVGHPVATDLVARTLVRFGRVATPVVACLVAAAFALAWTLMGGWPAWPPSAYAQAILLKLGLLLLLLGCAALNRWWLVPAYQRSASRAGPRLRASIAFELLLVVCVLFVTALLTTAIAP